MCLSLISSIWDARQYRLHRSFLFPLCHCCVPGQLRRPEAEKKKEVKINMEGKRANMQSLLFKNRAILLYLVHVYVCTVRLCKQATLQTSGVDVAFDVDNVGGRTAKRTSYPCQSREGFLPTATNERPANGKRKEIRQDRRRPRSRPPSAPGLDLLLGHSVSLSICFSLSYLSFKDMGRDIDRISYQGIRRANC